MGNRYLCGVIVGFMGISLSLWGYRWIYGYFVILMGVIVIRLT